MLFLISLIIISLLIMTALIVAGIVLTLKGHNSKKILVGGMVTGIIPVVLTTILLFSKYMK